MNNKNKQETEDLWMQILEEESRMQWKEDKAEKERADREAYHPGPTNPYSCL